MKELVRRAGRTDILVESAAVHTDEIGNDIHLGTREKRRQGKTRDIADPWYMGNFDATYDDVPEGCTAMLTAI